MLRDELGRAQALFAAVDFDLFELVEGERRYWVAAEAYGKPIRGWGFFVFNPEAKRQLVLEAPHPRHDLFTGEQAAALLPVLEAKALLISTIYRCASTSPSHCSGRTGACRQIWRRGRYRRSDVAHNAGSLFHAVHQALIDLLPEAVAIQIHGFYRRPGRKLHLIVSDGTRLPGGPASLSNRLARLLRRELPRKLRRSVRSCNERNNKGYLCATQNVQGRYANNSSNPCRRSARRSTGRFLHIEQSIDARRPGGAFYPAQLRRALEELWPQPQAEPPLTEVATAALYPFPPREPLQAESFWASEEQQQPDRHRPKLKLVSVKRLDVAAK